MTELSVSLIVKLASLVTHCEEGLLGNDAHHLDIEAIRSLVNDPEVGAWLKGIDPVLLPVKRANRTDE